MTGQKWSSVGRLGVVLAWCLLVVGCASADGEVVAAAPAATDPASEVESNLGAVTDEAGGGTVADGDSTADDPADGGGETTDDRTDASDDAGADGEGPEADAAASPAGNEYGGDEYGGDDLSGGAAPTPQPVLASTVEVAASDDDFGSSVLPIIADKCASCHAAGGPGASHWQITTVQDLVDTHLFIRGVVESNYMPPWPASDASVAFKDNRDLRPDQVQAIVDWSAAGAPVDVDPSTPVESNNPVVGLESPTVVLTPAEPYAGDPNTVDDYRCQVYDPDLPDGGWITGYQFIPDQTTVVHHAIGYVIEADRAPLASARDGEDGRPGWECYGSSGLGSGGLGSDDLFLGWAPGQDASVLPEGAGLWLPPDSFLVVQVHYHYDGDAPADLSALALTLDYVGEPGALDAIEVATLIAPVEIPCAEWESGPLCDRDAALADAIERFGPEGVPADRFTRICGASPDDFAEFTQGVAESSCAIPAPAVDAVGDVVSVLGHMHEIGSWFRMTLNPGRPDETVLLDIPDWDFDWQYNYVPEESLFITATDTVLIECGWDRNLRDPSLEPAYILWADGTNDEMCFATITVRK